MGDIRAAASGDFSATATWVGGVVPGSGDIAYANTFTVTISDTRTLQAVSNAAGTSITVGGTFSLLNGCNLACSNANGVIQGATTTSCITTPGLGVGSSASVAANYTYIASVTAPVVLFSTTGALSWTGNVNGGTLSGNPSFTVSGAGSLTYVGNLAGGTANTGSTGLLVSGNATVNITGNVTGSAGLGISMTNGTVIVTGTVTGGTTSAGIANSGSATLTVNGSCQSSTTQPAIAVGSTTQITRLSGPFLLGASGNINPVQAASWRWAPTQIPTYMEVPTSGGSTKRNLYTADNMPSGGYPTVGNVRQSTVYGPSSEFTGTLAVPAAASVALGVAVGSSTGTAILTEANVRAAVGMASANLDTQLAGISAPSAATVASSVWSAATRTLTSSSGSAPTAAEVAAAVRSELTTELGRIDAATSTRLAAASYSAAPTTAAIRTELSTELARLDVAVSTRLAPSGTLATVTTLTNAPSVPSAATIAGAVWTNTTRTITGGTIDNGGGGASAAEVADAVRTELTPELARVANCSTVDTTATTIQDALTA